MFELIEAVRDLHAIIIPYFIYNNFHMYYCNHKVYFYKCNNSRTSIVKANNIN